MQPFLRSYISLSVSLIRRFHLYRFLFYSLVSRQSPAHKLHTEWFVAIPGEKRREKWIGRKFISKSGCTRLKCFFPNATRKKKKKLFYITNSVLSVFSLFVRNLSVVVNWDNISSSFFLFAIDSNGGVGGFRSAGIKDSGTIYLFRFFATLSART